jgi:hypothetical protein
MPDLLCAYATLREKDSLAKAQRKTKNGDQRKEPTRENRVGSPLST